MVRTHLIENYQALRDSGPCLSHAATLPKATKLELGRGAHLKTPSSANHTAAASQPTDRIVKAASWLHLSRVSPALHPPERPSHTHTSKPGFGGREHEVYRTWWVVEPVALQLCFVAGDLLWLLVGCYLYVAYDELGSTDSATNNMCGLYLRQLHHLGPIISPCIFMLYLRVRITLVTLKGHRYYHCFCLRTEIEPQNKKTNCLHRENLL